MKRTEIKYVATADGKIKMTEINNVAGYDEIVERYGERVAKLYMSGRPRYYKSGNGIRLIAANATYETHLGSEPSPKELFTEFITILKVSGARLLKLAKETPIEPKEKTILR